MRINQSNLVIKLLKSLLNFGRAQNSFSRLYMDQISRRSCSVSRAWKKEIPRLPLCVKLVRNPFGVVSKATGQPGDEIISDAPFQKIITPASVGRSSCICDGPSHSLQLALHGRSGGFNLLPPPPGTRLISHPAPV
jgi:hypothetical protein